MSKFVLVVATLLFGFWGVLGWSIYRVFTGGESDHFDRIAITALFVFVGLLAAIEAGMLITGYSKGYFNKE